MVYIQGPYLRGKSIWIVTTMICHDVVWDLELIVDYGKAKGERQKAKG